MRQFLRPALLIAAVLTVLAGGGAHLFLKSRIGTGEFKNFAETKAAELLKARVQIRNIRLGLFNQVALSGLEVDSEAGDSSPYRFKVEQIVFRYSLYQLLTRNLSAPARVVLRAPEFVFQHTEFPYLFFENINFGSKQEKFSSMEITGGQFRLPVPAFKSELRLSGIRGTLTPAGPGRIEARFDAEASGIIGGRVRLSGEIQPAQKKHRLVLEFSGISAGTPLPVPLKQMSGRILWEDHRFVIEKMQAEVHGWDSRIQGELSRYRTAPVLALDWRLGKDSRQAGFTLQADFGTDRLAGKIQMPGGRQHLINGNIYRRDLALAFEQLRINDRYDGHGNIDFQSGDAGFHFDRLNQRIHIATNLQRFDFQLRFTLDHVKFAGLDFVTSARIHLLPEVLPGEGRIWKFRGQFETDFFIVNTVPFEDFRGGFEISPFGIRNFKAAWGEVFDAGGSVWLGKDKPDLNLTLRVNGFDLANVQEFASKPLPKKLGGLLEGRLRITGSYDHPEVQGKFSVKDGQVGKLKYDRGIFQIRGFPPYLPLQDSRILKGRTVLTLQGALDLKLKNMFHGVRIQTLDKIVLWNGWEITSSQAEGDLEIDPALKKLPLLAIQTGGGDDPADPAETKEEEPFVGIGPKIKF